MASRPCLECGAPSGGSRCPAHRGAEQRSHAWRKTSRRLRRRRPWCALCGSTERLSVDHIDGDVHSLAAANLRVLCLPCHGKATAERRRR